MPKQSLQRISHSSLTDHRILARAGEPLPESAFQLAAPQLPDLVHLNAVPQSLPDQIPELTLFRAYGELLASHPRYQGRFDSILDSLGKAPPNNPVVLSVLARRKLSEGPAESRAAAAELFQRAVQAGSADPYDFEELAALQEEAGEKRDAIQTIQHGLEANPYSPRLYRLLAALYVSVQSYDDALKTMKKGLELFPEDSYLRSLQVTVESAKGQEGIRQKRRD